MQAVTSVVVADTVLGGLFIAGKSCGPPNALTSSYQSSVIAKYLNATCFYIGPIIREITLNNTRNIPAWNRTFTYDLTLSNQTDPYVTNPVLTAYDQCVRGPISLQAVPSWLYYSFGPVVSIDADTVETASSSFESMSASDSSGLAAAVPAEEDAGQSSLLTQGGNQTGALQVPAGQLAGR